MKIEWNELRTRLVLKDFDFDKSKELNAYMERLNKNIKLVKNKAIGLSDCVKVLDELDSLYYHVLITYKEREELYKLTLEQILKEV